jgi:hypothetical protein
MVKAWEAKMNEGAGGGSGGKSEGEPPPLHRSRSALMEAKMAANSSHVAAVIEARMRGSNQKAVQEAVDAWLWWLRWLLLIFFGSEPRLAGVQAGGLGRGGTAHRRI